MQNLPAIPTERIEAGFTAQSNGAPRMPILCSVTREQFQSKDISGRPYTMELVHYTNATTGQLVRTRGYILPSNTVHVVEDVANRTEAPARHVSKLAEFRERAAHSLRAVTRQLF